MQADHLPTTCQISAFFADEDCTQPAIGFLVHVNENLQAAYDEGIVLCAEHGEVTEEEEHVFLTIAEMRQRLGIPHV